MVPDINHSSLIGSDFFMLTSSFITHSGLDPVPLGISHIKPAFQLCLLKQNEFSFKEITPHQTKTIWNKVVLKVTVS